MLASLGMDDFRTGILKLNQTEATMCETSDHYIRELGKLNAALATLRNPDGPGAALIRSRIAAMQAALTRYNQTHQTEDNRRA
jgi:phosphoketolase